MNIDSQANRSEGDQKHANRVALCLQDAHSLQDGIKYAQYAESKGFEAVWQAESRLVRDAIVPMAAFAGPATNSKKGGVDDKYR